MTTEQETEDNADEEFLHMMAVGEDFLEHHGVKGMKWGVKRSAHTQANISRLQKVAAGGGSKSDVVRVHLSSTPAALRRNKGTRGNAAVRSANLKARQDRLASGNASVRDKAFKNNTVQFGTGKKHPDTVMTPEHQKLTINKSDHPVTKAVKKDHNNLSDGHFQKKFGVTKKNYRKRVKFHNGDPFKARLNQVASRNDTPTRRVGVSK